MKNPLYVKDLSVAYEKKEVLKNVTFEIPEGKLIGIIGPNGAGKSTLIKSILGLVPNLTGEVEIYGKSYKEQRKLIGYVPQRESVDWDFPTDVLDVVMMGQYGHLGWLKRPRQQEKKIALKCLKQVGMENYSGRQISQLSGGQQQRIFLARALAQNAQIYFMDEPFVGVDAMTERTIISLLKSLKEQNKTVLVVHHDLNTVREYFDWVILLNEKIIEIGETEKVFTKELLQKTYGGKLMMFE